jgi:hypothetical protein
MSEGTTMRRPAGVMIVAALLFIMAIFNLALGVWLVLAPIFGNPTFTDIGGNAQTIPTFYLLINGILSVVLGLIYFWLMQMTLVGSGTAQIIITFFAVINIVFALFRLPYGWVAIVINILVLLMVYTRSAKEWFTQAP